jgi:hypothetical protein
MKPNLPKNPTYYILQVMEAMEFATDKAQLKALRDQYPDEIVNEAWELLADSVKDHVRALTNG